MHPSSTELGRRFLERLVELGVPTPGERVVVALSGGLDSLVLLHLLRFVSPLGSGDLVAAHLDHRLRPESPGDAAWLGGLLEAWGVRGRFRRLEDPPGNEEEARNARYGFLEEVRREEAARSVLLAHHADDQAETVLFRILRGTGIRGLRGIPERRDPGILRPLLPFWKDELRRYAGEAGIRPRFDESNLDRRFARNVLRHDVLPVVEEKVAPGARRALVRLARLAGEEVVAWEAIEGELLDRVVISRPEEPGREESRGEGAVTNAPHDPFVLDRDAFLAQPPALRARLLRRVLRTLGVGLDETGTRAAVAFSSSGASGGEWNLPDGLVLAREFDRLVIGPPRPEGPDDVLEVGGPGSGEAEFMIGGRSMRAGWAEGRDPGGTWTEHFSPSSLLFPLQIRGWNPGDRIRLLGGTKKLKKLFGERRIPTRERHRWPVVSDADGAVLWVPGLARSTLAVPRADDDVLTIGIADVDDC